MFVCFVNVICGGTGFKTVNGSGALIRALDAVRARSWKEEALRAERVEYQSTVWSDRENVMSKQVVIKRYVWLWLWLCRRERMKGGSRTTTTTIRRGGGRVEFLVGPL